jgi:integrase
MTILFSIFEKGILWDYCLTNPCKRVHRLKKNERPYRWWKDRSDIIKFLSYIKNNHYFLFFKTALETGLRRGELVGLTWDCIDLTTGRVELYRQYDANNKFSSLKNNKCRTIWVPTETLSLFRQQKAQSKSEFVFTKPDGTPVCASAISEKTFKTFQKNAKVPIINFHGLRHTYASHYMFNGGDIYKLSKLLGHSGVEVTQKYAHLSEEALMSSRDRVVFNVDNVFAIHTHFTHIEHDEESENKIKDAI